MKFERERLNGGRRGQEWKGGKLNCRTCGKWRMRLSSAGGRMQWTVCELQLWGVFEVPVSENIFFVYEICTKMNRNN